MGLGNSSEFGFGQRRENHLNCPSPRISSSPQQFENISEMTVTTDSFFGSGWDSLVSMDSHNHTNHSSYDALTLENQGISDISRLVQCSSGPVFNKLDQRLSCFRGGSYPETVTPVGGCKEAIHVATNQEERLTISDDRISESSSDVKKRKRMPKGCTVDSYSQLDSTLGVDVEQQKDNSLASVGGLKENDEKNKSQENSVVSVRKVTPKQAKDSSQNADSPNDGYIHVRARRGQATNSHSLAERVRREKISERMKFLQDLVPGCNKITGKAVMLDEIINYVQSLQRQVEFLSMKLATVNPELNFDLERILSKDILHSHGGGSSGFGFCQGMTASYPHLNGFQQRNLQSDIGIHNIENSGNMLKATNTEFSSLPQISVWDNELQSVVQMGFISNAPPDILDLQGQMKLEH